jgi:hypothetical protein
MITQKEKEEKTKFSIDNKSYFHRHDIPNVLGVRRGTSTTI